MPKKVYFAAVGRELHVDVPLSNVAIDYQSPELIVQNIAPIVLVPNLTGSFPEFSRRDRMLPVEDRRAPGTEANKIIREVSSDSFVCINHALKTGVTLEDRNNADPIYVQKLYNGAAEFVSQKLMLNWEVRVANKVTSGSNVGSYAAVASSWAGAASTPLADVLKSIDNVQDTTGTKPNKITFGDRAWRLFRRHSEVRNLIFGVNNGGGYPSTSQVANLLDIEQVQVGGAYTDVANRAQAESLKQVWNDNVLVSYTPPSASIYQPSFMYTFRWAIAGIPNMQAERHGWDSKTKSEEVEVGYYQDEKVTGKEYSYLLVGVGSSQ